MPVGARLPFSDLHDCLQCFQVLFSDLFHVFLSITSMPKPCRTCGSCFVYLRSMFQRTSASPTSPSGKKTSATRSFLCRSYSGTSRSAGFRTRARAFVLPRLVYRVLGLGVGQAFKRRFMHLIGTLRSSSPLPSKSCHPNSGFGSQRAGELTTSTRPQQERDSLVAEQNPFFGGESGSCCAGRKGKGPWSKHKAPRMVRKGLRTSCGLQPTDGYVYIYLFLCIFFYFIRVYLVCINAVVYTCIHMHIQV